MSAPVRAICAAVIGLASITGALAQSPGGRSASAKPRVPPGVDPGGVTVAVIGNGIDYTQPGTAARLARDGEGEIVGWDFLDDDRRPFERCGVRTIAADHCNEIPLDLLGSTKVRIIALRAGTQKAQSLVEAVRLASRAGARIVLVALPEAPPSRFIDDAAGFQSSPLYIATVVGNPRTPPHRLAMGDNFIVANAASDEPAALAATVAGIVRDAVDCAARGTADARTIRDCTIAIPPPRP